MMSTSWPALLMAMARFTDTLVLPTPPLPLVTAMTRTGLACAMRRSPDAWSLT